MKRKRSSNTNSQTTDLCGSFLVNVLDLSKILNGKNKSRTVHKLSCLKELLDLSPVSGSSSESTSAEDNNTIVISDSESESQLMENEVDVVVSDDMNAENDNDMKIKKETLFDHKKVSRFKKLKRRSSSCSDDDDDNDESEEENDISKIKNYVKESLLKGLAINSHKFSHEKLSQQHVKEEPVEVEVIGEDEVTKHDKVDTDCTTKERLVVESKEVVNVSVKRKRIRLTKRRNSSYQGKRLLRYYRNLKKRPKLERLISRPTRINAAITEHEEFVSKQEPKIEDDVYVVIPSSPVDQGSTKETAVQVAETIVPEVLPVEETLPSSTTNDQDILTLSRLEELKVQITEDETTVYITILDGTITIPDVLQVLRCTPPNQIEALNKTSEVNEIAEPSIVIPEVSPYFSQNEYKSCYTNASSTTGTNGK